MQWHILTHLGTFWAKPDGPQATDAEAVEYIRTVNAQGGTVSMDVNVADDGAVYPGHLAQLRAIAKAARGSK